MYTIRHIMLQRMVFIACDNCAYLMAVTLPCEPNRAATTPALIHGSK